MGDLKIVPTCVSIIRSQLHTDFNVTEYKNWGMLLTPCDTEFNLWRWLSRITEPTATRWEHLQRIGDSEKLAGFSRLGHCFPFPPVLDARFFISMAISQGKPRKELPWNSLGLKARRIWSSCCFSSGRAGLSSTLAGAPKCWEMVKLGRADRRPAILPDSREPSCRRCASPSSCFCFALICSGFGWDLKVHLLQNIC